MTYAEKLKHPKWQKKRLETLQAHNFTCQFCGETEKTLHVHHIMYGKSRDPWDCEDYMLTVICEDCHQVQHSKNLTSEVEEVLSVLQVNYVKHRDAILVINKFILNKK